MEFEWDDAKHAETLRDRGIGFDDGARIFAGPVVIWQDTRTNMAKTAFGPSEKAKASSAGGVYSAQRSSANNLGAAGQMGFCGLVALSTSALVYGASVAAGTYMQIGETVGWSAGWRRCRNCGTCSISAASQR